MEEINLEVILDKIEKVVNPIIEEMRRKQQNGSVIVYKGEVSNSKETEEVIKSETLKFLILTSFPR